VEGDRLACGLDDVAHALGVERRRGLVGAVGVADGRGEDVDARVARNELDDGLQALDVLGSSPVILLRALKPSTRLGSAPYRRASATTSMHALVLSTESLLASKRTELHPSRGRR